MPATDLALLEAAAREAGALALKHFRQDPAYHDKPGGAGPVSVADIEVDRSLRATLLRARPEYGWLSEETPDTPARLATRRQFIVDPIDGTRAYLAGSADWALSLAVVEDGRPIAAVVYLPARDRLYAARAGGGALRDGRPIEAAPARPLDGAEVLAAKPAFAPERWRDGQVPPLRRVFRSSLAYRLCLVAEGRFDAMLTLRPAWEWDIAAGVLICAEAGARATDPAGARLTFNAPHPQAPGVLAAPPALHAALAARLEPPQASR